ncbi:hypothetical protein NHX12_009689 [Muraenolepis orangiensis]|uniref:PH domain-containing protein n=1 Tax=Muraenolepis orangiensis TaxID=630683 RepID=A0A9Q0I854_9TELE|nr:hypothetical protein NHX12_009689 [Muraenolepis orangiensis]
MSAGDVVCTGWLIKSPPEKKLKRFTWRKRWFVLRRGRMSGNPDVLEYYQSQTSRKPIRSIDLRESEVTTQQTAGLLLLKRSLHRKFPFVVKTAARVFYLVAKTEEEMRVWTERIGQICRFGALKDSTALPHIPGPGHPLDYLFLSQCETGRPSVCISRCESFSTSESSLELRRSSDPEESVPHSFSTPPPSLSYRPPLSAPCPVTLDPPALLLSSCSTFSSTSFPPRDSTPSVFQFDGPFPSSSSAFSSFSSSLLCTNPHPAPPLPPKPCHQSQAGGPRSANELFNHSRPIPRRISFSGLDRVSGGHIDSFSLRNKRLSLNLPLQHFSPAPVLVPSCSAEDYVSMSSALTRGSVDMSDGYLPMRPLGAPGEVALRGQRDDLHPPPVNRHLKPRQRARPPPLDLRGLSTITEFPTRSASGLPMTSSSDAVNGFMNGRRYENEDDLDSDDCYTAMEPKFSDGASGLWTRRSNLDYLSLDFNSASPSPVQKKALLLDEHKVDYVQVDEKKTQALQSTRLEWTDVRQSKT